MPHESVPEGDLPHDDVLQIVLTADRTMPHESAPEDDLPHDDVPQNANPLERDEFLCLHGPRYRVAGRVEKGRILDEFVSRTGYHRKHAMRLLRGGVARPRPPYYDEDVREAVVAAWEAAGRPGSRRLKALLPELVRTIVKQGDLPHDLALYGKVLMASAATIDRLVAPVRAKTKVALFEEKLAIVAEVARDLADFHIPDELSEQERRYLEANLLDLVEIARQALPAEDQALVTSEHMVDAMSTHQPLRGTWRRP